MTTVSALKMTTSRARWPNTQAVKRSRKAFISRGGKSRDAFFANRQRRAVGRLNEFRHTRGQPGRPGRETSPVVPADREQAGLAGDNYNTTAQADRKSTRLNSSHRC